MGGVATLYDDAVHRHNSKYGHSRILKQFCGQDSSSQILGEVQHSFFLSNHHFNHAGRIGPPREAGQHRLVPLYSWSDLIPFTHQIPIGDPLLYDEVTVGLLSNSIDQDKNLGPVLVMPKLNEELSFVEREYSYTKLVGVAKELSRESTIHLSVHPRDFKLAQMVRANTGVQLTERSLETDPVRLNQLAVNEMASASLMVSDYFGAHVFRASALFGTPVAVSPRTALHRAIHPNLREILKAFLDLDVSSPERQEISRVLLGWEHRRNPEELCEILFRPSMSPTLKRIFVASYKNSRRIGVRLRQSSLWGRNPIARRWEEKVLRPKWEKRFPPIHNSRPELPPGTIR